MILLAVVKSHFYLYRFQITANCSDKCVFTGGGPTCLKAAQLTPTCELSPTLQAGAKSRVFIEELWMVPQASCSSLFKRKKAGSSFFPFLLPHSDLTSRLAFISSIVPHLPGFHTLIIFSHPPPHDHPPVLTFLSLSLLSPFHLAVFNSLVLQRLPSSPWPQLNTADVLYVNQGEGATQWIDQTH